jgi:hypothetical protein
MITMSIVLGIAQWILPAVPQTVPEQQVQLYYSQMVPNGSK